MRINDLAPRSYCKLRTKEFCCRIQPQTTGSRDWISQISRIRRSPCLARETQIKMARFSFFSFSDNRASRCSALPFKSVVRQVPQRPSSHEESAGIPAAPIQTIADMTNDEHLNSRGIFHRIHGQGDESFTAAGSPFQIDGQRLQLSNQFPELGADNAAVLARWQSASE